MNEAAVELPIAVARGRLRVNLAIAMNAGERFSVLTVQPAKQESPPDGGTLAGWIAAGWRLGREAHGNTGRGATIELQKGNQVDFAQALLAIEVDGKHFRVIARDLLTDKVDEPKKWKTIADWVADGWSVSDATGNAFHGAIITMQKPLSGG